MPAIRPFSGYLVEPAFAEQVVSPAYDSLAPHERYEFARRHPRNYLNAMRAIEDFPPHRRPGVDALLAMNARALEGLIAQGVFRYHAEPRLYLYRMEVDDGVQIGVVGEVPVEEYRRGLLKKHENTRRDREDRLALYLQEVGAVSSPVSLAYRQDDAIDAMVAAETARPPALVFETTDAVRHSVWRVSGGEATARLIAAFDAVPCAYLTDGHHRSAATARYAERRGRQNASHSGEETWNLLLVALFPHDQLRIRPFNRCVRDLDRHTPRSFLEALRGPFEVTRVEEPAPFRAEGPGCFLMRLDERTYRLRARPGILPADRLRLLDANLLQEQVLGPVLGIEDPRSDPRIDYLPGDVDRDSLARLRAAGWRVVFALHPPSMETLMATADAGETMPPKSTFFVPKLRSGVFVCRR